MMEEAANCTQRWVYHKQVFPGRLHPTIYSQEWWWESYFVFSTHLHQSLFETMVERLWQQSPFKRDSVFKKKKKSLDFRVV